MSPPSAVDARWRESRVEPEVLVAHPGLVHVRKEIVALVELEVVAPDVEAL